MRQPLSVREVSTRERTSDSHDCLRVAVIGTGHVGLVTCVSLAEIGHTVVGHDSDEAKVRSTQAGLAPFYEPGLERLLQENLEQERLSFTDDPAAAMLGAQIVFICVGTPARANGDASCIAIENVVREIAGYATPGLIVVEKSTVPAGTAHRVRSIFAHEAPDVANEIQVVSNPEFLREGTAVHDSLHPSRILVGAEHPWAFEMMRRLYDALIARGAELVETDITTSELSKHACNAFLALKISYANALARLCERMGGDVTDVTRIMGGDPRIGRDFLDAGLGYGGYCFPKDLIAFERLAASVGYDFGLLSEVAKINEEAVEATVEKIRHALWNLEGKRITVLGLSFKPGTDDVRFSPSLALARRLIAEGAEVVGYDPKAMDQAQKELPALKVAPTAYEAARGGHCVVLCTKWDEFLELDLELLRNEMSWRVMVDSRNVYEASRAVGAGFSYYGTGRASYPIVVSERVHA